MRGYFGIGVEGISKARNVGSLFRSAHAFGASFMFTLNATYTRAEGNQTDTSQATGHVPFYDFPDTASLILPSDCTLVGIELTDDAIELPSFHHPAQAAYVLGPEKSSLSPALQDRCDFIVKIPTKFCVNVGLAGAIVMYDRTISMSRFADRAVQAGGPTEPMAAHKHGGIYSRKGMKKFEAPPPVAESKIID
ncbi:MAG: RNA methyltransferase [Rhodospirillales bacterium]|jgi:tRNA G18 (ribose-2'-O)-methylase SpoU|nr:RNA methyltransferase [Rhodospirillales bacterium]MBT4040847.1 RNA methyltransferase [Rhodospirillales bacterium]MBT4625400.1 RNA methyltransferase [Rhodospirillales bacterium]MBT5351936.1 RNA methyltransferase [Rhodospirillales bacterium]MBT5521151.1 RNA methyltransferase [Rhodospirillales bacterium]